MSAGVRPLCRPRYLLELTVSQLSHLLTKPLLERNMRTVLDDARTQMRAMNGRPIVPTAEEPTPPRPGPMPSQAPSIPP
jgi:hypothetical protein